jgi:hypothetical protein
VGIYFEAFGHAADLLKLFKGDFQSRAVRERNARQGGFRDRIWLKAMMAVSLS